MGLGWLFSGAMPGALTAALAGAAAAAVVALHFVRLRRREVPVPFAALWLGLAGAASALRRSRRLRQWLALALALAVLAALLIAAVDPRAVTVDPTGRSWVFLIDRSASMSATDEPGSRLAAAERQARALAAGLGRADRALVASFAREALAETGFEADPGALDRGIARVTAGDEPADLPRALAFAAAVLRGRPRPTIALISDGGFTPDALRAAPPGIELRYASVGQRGQNAGILSLGARRIPADPGALDVGLTVQNFRGVAARVPVEITSGGAVVDRLTLELAAGERRTVALGDLFAPGAQIHARLTAADDLAADDAASVTIPPLPRRRVLRVGDADLYLDGALLSLGREVTVDRLPAAEADRALARAGAYDLIIFDGATPAAPPSEGRLLYLDPRGPGSPLVVRGRLRDPALDPATVRREHPLLRHVDLNDVNIAEAGRLSAAAGDAVLAASFGSPLIVARERPGLRVAVLAFDPRRSDLPLRPAFPLLIANALSWSAHEGVHPGPASGSDTVALSEEGRDARESDTAPVRRLQIGGQPVPSLAVGPPRRRVGLAVWAAGIALLLLVFEWITYHRRWTA